MAIFYGFTTAQTHKNIHIYNTTNQYYQLLCPLDTEIHQLDYNHRSHTKYSTQTLTERWHTQKKFFWRRRSDEVASGRKREVKSKVTEWRVFGMKGRKRQSINRRKLMLWFTRPFMTKHKIRRTRGQSSSNCNKDLDLDLNFFKSFTKNSSILLQIKKKLYFYNLLQNLVNSMHYRVNLSLINLVKRNNIKWSEYIILMASHKSCRI